MWKGKKTKELNKLYESYYEMFGCDPDWYDEVRYGMISYEDYLKYIQKAIELHEEFPDILE